MRTTDLVWVRAGRRARINQSLATWLATQQHLPLTAAVAYDGSVDLWPKAPTTTAEEVRVMRAFAAVTDARLRWHRAVTR